MYPSYLNLSKNDLNQRIGKLFRILENCKICPRKCRINRLKGKRGYCKLGDLPVVSAFHPHFGEERPLTCPHQNLVGGREQSFLLLATYLVSIAKIMKSLN